MNLAVVHPKLSGRAVSVPKKSSLHLPPQNGHEDGTVDEPANEPQGLQEPETEDIKTVPAGNTIYSSATSFEDLNLSPELLQVGPDLSCLITLL